MYKVMVNIYFKCQDGYDYMSHENSGIEHETKEEAYKELKEASKTGEDVYLVEYYGG